MIKNWGKITLITVAISNLCGCIAAATTVAGMGGSAAISHTMNGITYRTFTAPAPKVKVAARNALGLMKIKVMSESSPDKNNVQIITAKTSERNIEVQIEPISPNTTRMRVIAKTSGIFYDSATADEIIVQTKRLLG